MERYTSSDKNSEGNGKRKRRAEVYYLGFVFDKLSE